MIGQVLNSIHDGKITDYISSFILDRLREKYDVEFDVLAIGNYDMASGRVVAVCCARDDSKICFKVIADRKNIQDSYISICRGSGKTLFLICMNGLSDEITCLEDVSRNLLYWIIFRRRGS